MINDTSVAEFDGEQTKKAKNDEDTKAAYHLKRSETRIFVCPGILEHQEGHNPGESNRLHACSK